MIEHLPPLLKNTECTFKILSKTLQICQKETFLCCVVCFQVRAYWHWPKQITIVTDQVHKSLRSNVLVTIIILPHCIGKQAIMSDGTSIVIVLDNVLVILTSKLWPIDRYHPLIKICDASQGWDTPLSLSHQHNLAILRRCSPYSRVLTQLNSKEDKYIHLSYPSELRWMCKKLLYLRRGYATQWFTRAKCSSRSQ